MMSNISYGFAVLLIIIAQSFAREDPDWTPDMLKGLLDTNEPPRDSGKGPLGMLTSSARRGQDPPEDDLLDSLSQHGIHSESPSAHFLLGLYERLMAGQDLSEATGHRTDLDGADTVRSFSSSAPPRHARSRVSVKFHVSGMASGERTQMAELRLRPVDPDQPHHKSQIKRVKVTVRRNDRKVLVKRYSVKDTYDVREGFDIIDVTKIVRDVERELNGNMNDTTVEVSVKYKNRRRPRRSRRDLKALDNHKEVSSAILVIYSQDKKFFTEFLTQMQKMKAVMDAADVAGRYDVSKLFRSRQRRSATKAGKTRCKREDMTIDFDVIGWGQWIIYPKRYNAFKCSGKCPIPVEDSFEPTNHAVMQSLLRLKDKSAAPRPCCVPVALKPLSMLYYEDGELVVRHHEDMVVDRCGCR